MKIAFDLGGVITKYPELTRKLIASLQATNEIHVITDMPDRVKVAELIELNMLWMHIDPANIHCADYAQHGEACKAVVMRELGIDILVDDHAAYLAWPWPEPAPLRLFVCPDPRRPYRSPHWKAPDDDYAGFMDAVFDDSRPTDPPREGGVS